MTTSPRILLVLSLFITGLSGCLADYEGESALEGEARSRRRAKWYAEAPSPSAPSPSEAPSPSPSPSPGIPTPPGSTVPTSGPPTTGTSWYVRPGGAGAKTGADWNNAWDLGGITWANVDPGDVVWIAGGAYTTGLRPTKSGTATDPIYIARVTASDAVPTAAAGWNASFDARAVVTSSGPLVLAVSYVILDGRVDMGLRFSVTNGSGLPTSCNVTGGAFLTLLNLDLTGPNAAGHDDGSSCGNALVSMNGDSSGMMIGYGYSPNPGAHDITLSHSRVRGHANEFWFAKATNVIVENSMIYDNGAANSATWHGNLMIVNGSDGITFRNNEVFNWQVEGLYPWGSVSKNWHVYGNLFHDGIGGKNGSTHRFLEIRSYSGSVTHGPFYIYNNTITNCWAGLTRGDQTVYYSADSVARNNLFFNLANSGTGYAPPTSTNNYTGTTNPFVSSATGDFRLAAPLAGAELSAAYATDREGNTRGQDGTWDIGAFEYQP